MKKKLSAGILLIVTKRLSLDHFLCPASSWKCSPLGRPAHNRLALPLAAGQTEETAAYHKSVSHGPNGHQEGWAPLPPNYHLADTQKRSW